MIVIGVDVHKQAVTAVAVDEAGRPLDEKTVPVGSDQLVGWAAALGDERLWAVEDCRQLTRWLERQLFGLGEELVRVPPKLTVPERRAGRARGKSDPIDALAIARAALREPGLARPLPGERIYVEIKLLVGRSRRLGSRSCGFCNCIVQRLRQLHRIAFAEDVHVHHSRRFVQQVIVERTDFDSGILQFLHDRADLIFRQDQIAHDIRVAGHRGKVRPGAQSETCLDGNAVRGDLQISPRHCVFMVAGRLVLAGAEAHEHYQKDQFEKRVSEIVSDPTKVG